jgi:hypothetical protein
MQRDHWKEELSMRKRWPVLVGLVLLTLVTATLAVAAGGKTYKATATMTASAEVPKPKGAKGTGAFSATVTENAKGGVMKWQLTFTGLTGRALAAHIHLGKTGVAGPIIVPLCGPCQSGQQSMTAIGKDTIAALKSGRAYVNVHTKKNPAGEIRGQIKINST